MAYGYAVSKSSENQKEVRRLIKWLLIIVIVPLVLLLILALVCEYMPGYGSRALRKVLNDTSAIESIEVIRESQDSAGLDYNVRLDAKIPIDAARQIVQGNALRRCNEVVDGKTFTCSDPVWEVPSEDLMYHANYSENTICTMSWRSDIGVGRNFEDTDVLCVDTVTGELWFSHYSY